MAGGAVNLTSLLSGLPVFNVYLFTSNLQIMKEGTGPRNRTCKLPNARRDAVPTALTELSDVHTEYIID